MKKLSYALLCLFGSLVPGHAQNHTKSAAYRSGEHAPQGFVFTTEIKLDATPVKNQHLSGTCWSHASTSFLESEMIRAGRKPVDLSEMFSVRNQYIEKAEMYVRLHGGLNYGEGGEPHDVINLYRKYGALPYALYPGLNYGTRINRFGEFSAVLKGMLKAVVQNKNGQLSTAWLRAFTAVVDSYLGSCPKTFTYAGKTYTPKSFAREVVGLNPDDYLEFTSWKNKPVWQPVLLTLPDNWSYERVWNIPFEAMTQIVDYALRKGYTVSWETDIREAGFSRKKGIAYVTDASISALPDSARARLSLFDGPKQEPGITAEMRQKAFDNYRTTDDHNMQIVGLAKDQNGEEYYIVKNSWGIQKGYAGYWYVTKSYFKYKTTNFLLNSKALPPSIRRRIADYGRLQHKKI